MIHSLKTVLSRNITNARGWRTDRKIVVIESDDWGSIRMPNLKVKKKYEELGYDLSNNPYCNYDTLADSEDLEVLFDCLSRYKDEKGNNAKITFNTVMGNPLFENILETDFKDYSFEPFTETLKRYYPNENVFDLWKQGIKAGLIQPQYHGREHVNVPLWLKELKNDNKPLLDAFHLNFWGIPENIYKPQKLNIQASYDSSETEHLEFYKSSIAEGLGLFEKIFEFKSSTFIANNYIWSSELNKVLLKNGVIGLQGMKYQLNPLVGLSHKHRKSEVYTGKVNEIGQVYSVRNCFFEPSHHESTTDYVNKCLKQIEQAFLFKKPAIITSHRINYIGALDKKNRSRTIKSLNTLFCSILERWPEVEFLSSDQLVEIINN